MLPALLAILLLPPQDDPAALLRAGRFRDALPLIESQLAVHPGDPRLLTMRGIAQSQTGGDTGALASFRAALTAASDYLPALEGAAQLEYKTNDPGALAHLNRLIHLNNHDQTAHAMRAVIYARHANCQDAVADFQAAGQAIDRQPAAAHAYSACLLKLKRWPEAEQSFARILASNPADRQAAYGLASVQMEAGHQQAALETLKTFPADAYALALSANALENLERTPEAIAALRQAILADPRQEDFYVQFGELCFTYKSYQAGVDVLSAGLTQLPASAKLHLSRAILLVQQGNYNSADKDFAQAEQLNPREADTADAAVLALIQANRLDQAKAALDAKIKLHPRDPELWFLLADVSSRLGDLDASMQAARRAIVLKPEFHQAHDLLGRLYQQGGQLQQAIEESKLALQSDPEDEVALYRWLRILKARHSPEDEQTIADLTRRWQAARQKQQNDEVRESRYRILTSPGTSQ